VLEGMNGFRREEEEEAGKGQERRTLVKPSFARFHAAGVVA